MNMITPALGHAELRHQAGIARALGSSFVAAVLEAGQRQLYRAPRTQRLIETWPGDPIDAALAMRFNAALHALARRNKRPRLSALYRGQHDDFDSAIAETLDAEDAFIAEWMRHTPQTNEVGRAASIAAALMVLQERFAMPVELLELGASCGLNLNLGHYGYTLGGIRAGIADSPVQVTPAWSGPPPINRPFAVAAARGIDLNPLSATDSKTRERLLSFVWADEPERAQRLEDALALAVQHPPQIDRGNAVPWLARQLSIPHERRTCRVVYHSMVLQYMTGADRAAIETMIAAAGRRATPDRPIARISFERERANEQVQLILTCWPYGEQRLLAHCHTYGKWIAWH